MTGICDLRAIAGSASASSWLGHATRTMSQPAAVSSAICCRVALTSAVSVVVMDCTLTGAPPPTGTEPTISRRLCRRGASAGGGTAGMPRLIAVTVFLPEDRDRVDDVGGDREQREGPADEDHRVRDGHELEVVDPARVGLLEPGVQPGADPLEPNDGDMPAVERQQRQQVEDADEDVQRDEDHEDVLR